MHPSLLSFPLSFLLPMLALATLAACGAAPAPDPLFPLEAGAEHTYQVVTTHDNAPAETETLTLRSLGRDDLDSLPTWRRRSEGGADYWLRQDDTGIYRVASKSDAQRDPQPDARPRYVLRRPYAVGTQWRSDTAAYLLRRRQTGQPDMRYTQPPVQMDYAIDALEQTVQTPAGRFEHCLRVKGTALMPLFVDPVAGAQDVPLTTLEWYCPGPGLVRLERREQVASKTFLSGGTLTMELSAWRRG